MKTIAWLCRDFHFSIAEVENLAMEELEFYITYRNECVQRGLFKASIF